MSLPDKMTLDRLVRGDAQPDDEAWAELLDDPEATRAWSGAQARRRALDRGAQLAWRSPWLAGTWLALRRAGRRLSQLTAPTPGLVLLEPDITLAAAGEPPPPPLRTPLTLSWGEVGTQVVRPGQALALELAGDETLLWRGEHAEGELTAPSWAVEAGQGVVLLLAVRGPHPESVEAALTSGQPFAGLLLIPEGETRP